MKFEQAPEIGTRGVEKQQKSYLENEEAVQKAATTGLKKSENKEQEIDNLKNDIENNTTGGKTMTAEEIQAEKEAKVDARIKTQIEKENKEKMSFSERIKYELGGGIPVRMALAHMTKERPQFVQTYRELLDEEKEEEAQNLLKMYAENPRGYVYRGNGDKLKDITTSSIGGGAPEGGQ